MEGSEGGKWTSVVRRRLVAGLVLLALAGAAVFVLVGDDSEGDLSTTVLPPSISAQSSILSAQLSRDQLVDQVLLLGFDGSSKTDAPILGVLATRQLGGVIVQAQNWTDAAHGAALTRALRAAGSSEARIRPLVVAAQEGGRYRSFADLPPQLTGLEIGDRGSIGATEAWARDTGRALRASGFDLNLFPVADVATLDSPIGDRAFSDDPVAAAQLTAAALRGCREARIACAPLHFPGLGAASQDTGQGPATVGLDEASLAARDLQAFRAAFAEHVPAVVLSLAFYAAYDPVTPGALAEPVATGLLRDELGFDGVAITDDLGSGAVRSDYSVAKAAVAALVAGADMLQIDSPAQQAKVRDALLTALDSGELSEARLREAAGRVLELKRKLGLLTPQ